MEKRPALTPVKMWDQEKFRQRLSWDERAERTGQAEYWDGPESYICFCYLV
jgi:hypothetical protein